ncbi:MAG: hypothetical protein IPP85_18980 [Propionivibrio sp.]|nr:hypothetical protein [Propionivibrio sp.]
MIEKFSQGRNHFASRRGRWLTENGAELFGQGRQIAKDSLFLVVLPEIGITLAQIFQPALHEITSTPAGVIKHLVKALHLARAKPFVCVSDEDEQ